jgi:gamma-aminobutyric acid receptor subunit beta
VDGYEHEEYATVGYMAKRIQMRKQRFMAIQKIAEQKKTQMDNAQQNNPPSVGGSVVGPPSEHSHSHGHSHSHHPHVPKQQMTMNRGPPGMSLQGNVVTSRGCSIVGPLFQEVRFKVHDPKAHSKGGTLENTINGGRGQQPPPAPAERGADEESGGGAPPQHLIHPGKVSRKFIIFHFIPSAVRILSSHFRFSSKKLI